MRLIHKHGKVEIWHDVAADEYYVLGVTVGGDARVCPSLGMAYEVAASA